MPRPDLTWRRNLDWELFRDHGPSQMQAGMARSLPLKMNAEKYAKH